MELNDLIGPLKRWWWLLFIATALAAISSVFYIERQPRLYRTSTTLLVGSEIWQPNPNSNELWLSEQLARRYVDIVLRRPIQEAAKDALGIPWVPNYTARVVPNSQFLEISVAATDPKLAQQFANELANQLISLNVVNAGAEDDQFIKDQLARLEKAITETQDQIEQKQIELTELYSAREIAKADEEIESLQRHLANLRQLYSDMYDKTTEGAVNTLRVFERAPLPDEPIRDNGWATVLLSALIGLTLASGAAYFMEYLDDTVETPDEAERQFGLRVLSSIPQLSTVDVNQLVRSKPEQYAALEEALWGATTNLLHVLKDSSFFSLLVTSALPNEGKTLISIQLAVMLARTGRNVVLVDADLRKPDVHNLLGLNNEFGVTDALSNPHVQLEQLWQDTPVSTLHVLTAGTTNPEHIPELIEGSRIQGLLERFREAGIDTVLFDSPPVNAVSDAIGLALHTDAVLALVQANSTRRRDTQRALKRLQQVDANVLGIVLNRASFKALDYATYSYYYYTAQKTRKEKAVRVQNGASMAPESEPAKRT